MMKKIVVPCDHCSAFSTIIVDDNGDLFTPFVDPLIRRPKPTSHTIGGQFSPARCSKCGRNDLRGKAALAMHKKHCKGK